MAESETLPALIRRPEYSSRFQAILKDRTEQFTSSILQIGATMPDVEPRSILAAAMMGASLDLPINKSLGFAWIVPYRVKGGRALAQFQIGSKGYIQLALRSGTYRGMNARSLNAEAITGWNELGEPIIDWAKLDESKLPTFYFFGWLSTNGFSKVAAWSEARVRNHAKRYSQSYNAGAAIWRDNFHEMALKTVVANELRKFGVLSIQMQRALFSDQYAARDIGAEPEAIDGMDIAGLAAGDKTRPESLGTSPPEDEKALADAGLAPTGNDAPEGKSTPEESPQDILAKMVTEAGFTFDDFARLGRASKWEAKWDDVQAFADVPEEIATTCVTARRIILSQLQKQAGKKSGLLATG